MTYYCPNCGVEMEEIKQLERIVDEQGYEAFAERCPDCDRKYTITYNTKNGTIQVEELDFAKA